MDDIWKGEMMTALDDLLLLLKDERTVSAYELHSSGLVQALFNTLNVSIRCNGFNFNMGFGGPVKLNFLD